LHAVESRTGENHRGRATASRESGTITKACAKHFLRALVGNCQQLKASAWRGFFFARRLKQRYAERRQQSLQDSNKTNQHHENFEQVGELYVPHKSIDNPEQNRAYDDDDQGVYQDQDHLFPRSLSHAVDECECANARIT
jgi:hypothetical protein